METIEGWGEALRTEVNRRWSSSRKALLLSQVPRVLSDSGTDVRSLVGSQKLSRFLEAKAALLGLRVEKADHDELVLGLVPQDAVLNSPNSENFGFAAAAPDSSKLVRKLPGAVWAAFTTPLANDFVRVAELKPEFRFRDVPEAEATVELLLIERLLLVDPVLTGKAKAQMVFKNLEEWMKNKRVDSSDVFGRRSARSSSARFTSPLDDLLQMFTPAERSRISLPLDVIARLLNH
jgi:hypothetical protein